MTYRISSGVYPNEIDLSAGTRPAATTIGAAVFASQRGPIGPTLITRGTEQFDLLFGQANSGWSNGHYNARAFLAQSKALWVRRVVNNALYAGTAYFNDPTPLLERTLSSDFAVGSSEDYEDYSKESHVIAFTDRFVTANQFDITMWDGVAAAVTNVTVPFNTDSNTTMADIATAVQSAMDAFATGGTVSVVDAWNGPDRRQVVTLTMDDQIVNGDNTFTMTVTVDGVATVVGPVVFNTDNDTTLDDIATAITVVAGVSATARTVSGTTGASNRVIAVTADNAGPDMISVGTFVQGGVTPPTPTAATEVAGAGVYDDRLVRIVPPEGMTLQLTNELVTLGATQTAVTVSGTTRLFEVFAENPGDWANDVGVKVVNPDTGINQRISLTANMALQTGGSFSAKLYNSVTGTYYDVGPVAFNTDSDTTLGDIATAINLVLTTNWTTNNTGSATVTAVASTTSDAARTIVLIAPNSNVEFSFVDPAYQGTGAGEAFTSTETLARLATNGSFELEVYTRDNVRLPVERWTVTLDEYVDGSGNQLFIEDVVNVSANKSSYIRIKVGAAASTMNVYTADTSINWLAKGDDGSLPTDGQITTAWDDFSDPEAITMRMALNCGYTAVAVQQRIDAICQSRKDCIAILDIPSASQDTVDAYNYRRDTLNINSSYSALYTPDLKIIDSNTNRTTYIPPCGHVAARYAYTDRVAREWFAPAGLQRGILSEVVGLRKEYAEGDRDVLEPAQINPIRAMKGRGYVIWGAETAQARPSALSNVPVRRLNITIAVTITDALHYFNWEPNDDFTRFAIEQIITDFMNPIQAGRGVYEFQVVSDSTNNTSELIDQGILVVDLYYKPVLPAKFIKFNMILTKTGADFSELIAAGGGIAITG